MVYLGSYIYHKHHLNVGKYPIHGSYGSCFFLFKIVPLFFDDGLLQLGSSLLLFAAWLVDLDKLNTLLVKQVSQKNKTIRIIEGFEPVWRRDRVPKIASFEGPMILRNILYLTFCPIKSQCKYLSCILSLPSNSASISGWSVMVDKLPPGMKSWKVRFKVLLP